MEVSQDASLQKFFVKLSNKPSEKNQEGLKQWNYIRSLEELLKSLHRTCSCPSFPSHKKSSSVAEKFTAGYTNGTHSIRLPITRMVSILRTIYQAMCQRTFACSNTLSNQHITRYRHAETPYLCIVICVPRSIRCGKGTNATLSTKVCAKIPHCTMVVGLSSQT